ncbi:hypothetical protein M427DRAFT_54911 [Gonapodya prolifera JEL478]|uniref:Prolyl 4-hydroxylase alpha subunit domain-containing protein n=1 Tax=Gonapodya prolifera (strain JEL478) TaxID=1344416 RepID=A0A139ALF3_GONPJ|nr:hypothetical protein M427DRAFT_54911 [Gonapodya prolifera JEL478]|eukprot:KXS17255.1 hypothetical protein M427DRAFT_54911 [Gonapodya prolifera JEL478]
MPSIDLPSIVTVLVAASLALHVPTYLRGTDLSFHTGLANFPSPFSSPVRAPHEISPQRTKLFGDPNDGLLGDPFNGEEDYVCDTTFRAVRIVNRDPLVMYIEGFLRKGEPEWIISKANPLLARSSVVDVDDDPTEKRNATSLYRTSSTAFLTRSGDRILRCIESRASTFTGVPVRNTEGLQVTYYKEGQEYKPHWDYFPREFASMGEQLKRGGQRVTTLFAYLNTVPLPASFTGAPNSAFPASYTPPDEPPRPRAQLIGAGATQFPDLGVEVFPVKGAAAMWWDVGLKGEDDPR